MNFNRPGKVSPMRSVPPNIERPEYATTGKQSWLLFLHSSYPLYLIILSYHPIVVITTIAIVIVLGLIVYYEGEPVSEQRLRGSNKVDILTPDEIECLRESCRVCIQFVSLFYLLFLLTKRYNRLEERFWI